MPEESKKGNDKKKNDPKEQRRPRQRHQAAGEKQVEKKVATEQNKTASKSVEPKNAPKVPVPQKPVYESPPPEFFQNLKRETDEILKITEEENQKYKKKEIQSNWTKYEMPIESYDDIEEQENIGADYEKLIQAPLSIGGHFQFKHEKSWDVNTGPSLYDKYFDINMEELNLALCTIPFHERNSIEESIFSQTDLLSMNNRTARFKQKYYDDKSYATAETEAQDKILNSLREKETDEKLNMSNDIEIKAIKEVGNTKNETKPDKDITNLRPIYDKNIESDNNLELKADLSKTDLDNYATKENIEDKATNKNPMMKISNDADEKFESIKDVNTKIEMHIVTQKGLEKQENIIYDVKSYNFIVADTDQISKRHEIEFTKAPENMAAPENMLKAADPPQEPKNPIIESPEDLEKWLDDFLDG